MNAIRKDKIYSKIARRCFSKKGNNSSQIALIESNTITSDKKRIADLMNKFFINIKKKTLNLKPSNCKIITGIDSIIKTFENHISIKK